MVTLVSKKKRKVVSPTAVNLLMTTKKQFLVVFDILFASYIPQTEMITIQLEELLKLAIFLTYVFPQISNQLRYDKQCSAREVIIHVEACFRLDGNFIEPTLRYNPNILTHGRADPHQPRSRDLCRAASFVQRLQREWET